MRLLRTLHSIVFSLGLACAPALATDICGPLNGTLTLAGSPYVATCSLSVAFGDTLNLEPGVEIRFQDATSLTVDGTLNAKGTAVDGVLFTSNSGVPIPGIWFGVIINGQGTFDYATVRYADANTVTFVGSADFTNCVFEQNNLGLRFEAGSSGSVTGGTFSLNIYGLVILGDTSVTASGAVFDQNGIAGYMMGPNVYPVLSNLTVNENHAIYNGIGVDPWFSSWSKGGTWTDAGCPYVMEGSDLNFDSGVTFAVEAGAVIKVSFISLNFETLDVNGTSGSPVVFTSYRDDSVGGDTNADADASSPSQGDWTGLTLNGTGSTLDYAAVKYASSTRVSTEGAADFTDCAFEQNDTGLWFDVGSSGSVTGGSFSLNNMGLAIAGDTSVTASGAVFDQNYMAGGLGGPNAYPVLSNLTVNENHTGYNGIVVSPLSTWSNSGTWTNPGCPYVIEFDYLDFDPGTTLTVKAGVVLKMSSNTLTFDNLVVNGTSGSPVVFTSLWDDSVGGDTNADGPTSGTPGEWNGIRIISGTTHTLDGLTVSYAGTGVVFEGVTGTVDQSSFFQNLTGLSFELGGSAVVTNSSFAGNNTGVSVDASSLPVLGDLNDASPLNDGLNDFVCNTVHVSNSNAATVLAENNWWGDAPPNPALFVGGVDYDPYLTGQSQAVLTGMRVSLANGNADVRLAWENAAPACGYRVLRSTQPDSGFADISGLLFANTFDDVGAGSSGIDYFYLVAMD